MTDQTHPALVGIDGTASGLEALALANALAVLTGSPLVLAAVYGSEGEGWPPPDLAQQWLEEAAGRVEAAIPWSTASISSSSPAHGLTVLAARERAGLIVVGSSRRGPLGRVLLGSTARSVTHAAPCAVAVVPHGWHIRPADAPLTFGVGLTASVESRDALALAARLAVAPHAPLRVLTAVHIPPPEHPMFAATGTSYARWCRDLRRDAERTAHEAVAAVAGGEEAEIVVVDGDPVDRLAEASRGLDLLVVGSRRYGPLRSALLGGVSSQLIDRVHCPLLIVPRGVHADPLLERAAGQVAHA